MKRSIVFISVMAILTMIVFALGISDNPIITLVPFAVLGIFQLHEKKSTRKNS
jgi:hypothetical protein